MVEVDLVVAEVEAVEAMEEVEGDPWAAASDLRLVWAGQCPDWKGPGGLDTPRY